MLPQTLGDDGNCFGRTRHGRFDQPSGEEAAKRFGGAQEQDDVTALNDPLLEAFMMMALQLMDQGVPESMLNALGDGMLCPVCTAMALTVDHTPESTELHWTAGLADHILSVYRERGLSPKLQ